jgi:hypothetical protein
MGRFWLDDCDSRRALTGLGRESLSKRASRWVSLLVWLLSAAACSAGGGDSTGCECAVDLVCVAGTCRAACGAEGTCPEVSQVCVSVGEVSFCADRPVSHDRAQPAGGDWQESRSSRFVVRGGTAPWGDVSKSASKTVTPAAE